MKNKNKNSRRSIRVSRLNVWLLILLLATGLIQVFVANYAASQRYAIAQFRTSSQQLEEERNRLTLRVAELQSIERVQVESAALHLVAADNVYYLTPHGSVALRK